MSTQEERTLIARRHGIPEELATRLVGESEAELEADATKVAEAINARPEPEHVRVARQAIEAGESNPNAYVLAALRSKDDRDRAVLEAMHPKVSEE